MSQYAQDSDLLQLALNSEQAAQFSSQDRVAAIVAASGFADSYLTSQFQLPLSAWDQGLTFHVCSLAAYWLFARRGMNPEAPEDQVLKQRAEMAMAWLRDIAEEKVHPKWTDASGGSDTDAAGPFVITSPSRGWRPAGSSVSTVNCNDEWDPFSGL